MLFLQFRLGTDRYLLDSREVVEVLPLLELKHLPLAPAGVAGLFDYHGRPVPVIDLSAVMLRVPAASSLSTRLIVVRYPPDADRQGVLGLIAEHATSMLRLEEGAFRLSGVHNPAAPYLGPVASDAQGMLQWVEIERLLPAALQALLFPVPEEE